MDHELKKELTEYLFGFVAERRKQRLYEVLSQRTGHLRVVLENLYQAHNASAVLRSCDCFGVQHVHIIENRNQLRISEDVAMGSSNWLSMHRHRGTENNTLDAIHQLKAEGFRIVATSLDREGTTIDRLKVDKKLALVFGTEIDGISADVINEADEFVKIPMFGFTESFNVSVSAALCMYELTRRIRESVPGHLLTGKEKEDVMFDWLKNSVDYADALIADYLQKKKI